MNFVIVRWSVHDSPTLAATVHRNSCYCMTFVSFSLQDGKKTQELREQIWLLNDQAAGQMGSVPACSYLGYFFSRT